MKKFSVCFLIPDSATKEIGIDFKVEICSVQVEKEKDFYKVMSELSSSLKPMGAVLTSLPADNKLEIEIISDQVRFASEVIRTTFGRLGYDPKIKNKQLTAGVSIAEDRIIPDISCTISQICTVEL